MTSWRATVKPPGERCTHVHEHPGVSSVTSHTNFGIRGCLISNRLPTARLGTVEADEPGNRRRPFGPVLDVAEYLPNDAGRRIDLNAALRNHVPDGT